MDVSSLHHYTTSFNPCSGGLEMAARLLSQRQRRVDVFQSLFWWIGDGGEYNPVVDTDAGAVSILVLVDWRWRPDAAGALASIEQGFNPCSGGLEMAACKTWQVWDDALQVSILVLVDWRWRRGRRCAARSQASGFNPCSGGLEMAAHRHAPAPRVVFEVSILVLVDWRWRQIFRWGETQQSSSFNPCSGGLEMAASYFEWIEDTNVSFNPCSGGLEMAADCRQNQRRRAV